MIKKILLLALLAAAVHTTLPAQRTDMTINTGWYFHKGDVGLADNGFSSENGEWEKLNLPHTWNRRDAFDEEKGYYRGTGWYALPWMVPASWEGRRVVLHFEGANQVAEVFVNGTSAGSHTGGYTAFRIDVTDLLKYGSRNIVKVKLDNSHNLDIPPLDADFTFYGGIYRNVRVIITEPVHFALDNNASDGVFVETDITGEREATVTVRGEVANDSARDKKVVVETVLFLRDGAEIARTVKKMTVKARSKAAFTSNVIRVSEPEMWSPESPTLYKATTRIVEGGVVSDEMSLPVGFRSFEFNGTEGFKLNGEKYHLKGANRHQDFAGLGNALTDEYHANDFRRIKEMGFNFVRLAHYPQAPEVYRICDEVGLLVWTEIPIVNRVTDTPRFTENSITMLREQIRQTYNHPSVIMYGYMNEILIRMLSNKRLTEEERTEIAGYTRKLALKLEALVETEAPDRASVMALHYEDGYNQYDVSTITDVIGYNLYFGWYYENLEDLTRFLESEHSRYPSRPIIVSEFGPDTDVRIHTLTPRPWDFSEDYQIKMHSSYLDQMGKMPWLAGYALWNFADFGAEHRADAIPWINQKGLVNHDRTEKDVVGLYMATNLSTPVLRIASRNYTDRRGIETIAGKGVRREPLTIFSNGREVELFNNGSRLGTRTVLHNRVSFEVDFTDGENLIEVRDDRGSYDRLTISYTIIPLDIRSWIGGKGRELAVDVGSYQTFSDLGTGTVWIPDRVYEQGGWGRIGGEVFERNDRQLKVGISNNILGTECNPLFQTFVENIEAYRFDVGDGIYRVKLCFVENNTKTPTDDIVYNFSSGTEADKPSGVREFNVSINGNTVIPGLNIARDYGTLRAVQFDVTARAEGGAGITVGFEALAGKTTLSGIKIERLD